jgi:hypothetical protein
VKATYFNISKVEEKKKGKFYKEFEKVFEKEK